MRATNKTLEIPFRSCAFESLIVHHRSSYSRQRYQRRLRRWLVSARKGRVAIVTGSSKGMRKAIALGLAQEGAKIVMCARNREQLNMTAMEIQHSANTEVLAIVADLTRRDDIKALMSKAYTRFGRIDILVNNTGGPPSSTFLETSEEDWDGVVNLLLMSVVNCCREVIPIMQKQKWGRIINMTSFAAKQPAERLILSNAIRAGIFGLSKTLSNELAVDGVLVNSVCPGWTLTTRVEELAKAQAKATGNSQEDVICMWENSIPLKRLAQPKEIAALSHFRCVNTFPFFL